MKLICPWKGCKGVIDVEKDIRECTRLKGPEEIPWCEQTLVCPKCHNVVGHLSVEPNRWYSMPPNAKFNKAGNCTNGSYIVRDPRTHKSVRVKKGESLDKYLKKWAVWKPPRKRKVR